MNTIHKRLLAALVAALFIGGNVNPAIAQAQPASAEQQAPEVQVPEVTVQDARVREGQDARVREGYRAHDATVGVLGDLPLIDTPYSINVIPRQLIQNQQALVFGDYLKNDPSAGIGNVPVGFGTLRGFSIGIDGPLYDGLPGATLLNGRYHVEGIERVEILKGPSAFLYGLGASTSLGGTINHIPKRPLDLPVRSVTASYLSQSNFGVHADLGDRFGADSRFGYRVNLAYRDGEQAVEHARWRHGVATLALDWRVSPNLLLTAGYDDVYNNTPRFQSFFGVLPGVPVPAAPKLSRNISPSWQGFDTRDTHGYLRADWSLLPEWSLTAQYMNGKNRRPGFQAARFGPITNAAGDIRLFGTEDVLKKDFASGQILLHGKFSTGFVSHRLTVGVSQSDTEQKEASVPLGVFPTNLYNPSDSPRPPRRSPQARLTQKTKASSVLIGDILRFSEQWSVLVGARHAKLELRNFNRITGAVTKDISQSKTSPTVALMFQPQPNALLYANYAEGLEQGGVAPAGTTNQNQALSPITTKQVEVGTKLELRDLTLTAAVFDMKRPFEFVDVVTNTFVQNGEQEHRGIELLATGRVTRPLTLVGGVMWLDPKTNRTGNPATEGKRPIGVSRATLSLYGEYQLDATPGLFLTAATYYKGGQFVNAANTQQIPSSTRFDVGARYETRIQGRNTTFLVGIENLANHNYWAGAQSGILTLAEPRTFKASVRLEF